jgi:hypothetical protein
MMAAKVARHGLAGSQPGPRAGVQEVIRIRHYHYGAGRFREEEKPRRDDGAKGRESG